MSKYLVILYAVYYNNEIPVVRVNVNQEIIIEIIN